MHGVANQERRSLALYFQDIASSEPLPADEERRLAQLIRQGDPEARNVLVTANLRFVVRVACRYQGLGAPLPDLINAGNVGLVTAADRFDGARGFRFVTYAVWWIRQAITESLSQDLRMVRLPANRIRLLHSITSVSQELSQTDGAEPDPDTVAGVLGASVEMVQDTLMLAQDVRSLDAWYRKDGDVGQLHVLPDNTQEAPDAQVIRDSVREQIEAVLDTLEDREAQVIRFRFGIGKVGPLTLREIGMRLGLTRERVRQIEKKALSRLQHPRRRALLTTLIGPT